MPHAEHNLTGLNVFSIPSVEVIGPTGEPTDRLKTGQHARIRFSYKTLKGGTDKVTFVLSIYRHDMLYICGTTTLMEKIPPFVPGNGGEVEIELPNLRLLAGSYVFRVAIDDDRAFGIYVEQFTKPIAVVDNMEAVGLMHIERRWSVKAEGVGYT